MLICNFKMNPLICCESEGGVGGQGGGASGSGGSGGNGGHSGSGGGGGGWKSWGGYSAADMYGAAQQSDNQAAENDAQAGYSGGIGSVISYNDQKPQKSLYNSFMSLIGLKPDLRSSYADLDAVTGLSPDDMAFKMSIANRDNDDALNTNVFSSVPFSDRQNIREKAESLMNAPTTDIAFNIMNRIAPVKGLKMAADVLNNWAGVPPGVESAPESDATGGGLTPGTLGLMNQPQLATLSTQLTQPTQTVEDKTKAALGIRPGLMDIQQSDHPYQSALDKLREKYSWI